jgi:hypothetical protein
MDLIKITPDKERARSILEMVMLIEKRISIQDRKTMSALIIADYYEILKEIATAVLLADGFKTLSHIDLIKYVETKYGEFSSHEISVFNDLRVLRNRISYEGFKVGTDYLERNEELFREMVLKFRKLVSAKAN